MKKVIAVLLLYGTLFSAGNITAGDWTENIKVKGDLRYRHEMIDKQDSDSRHRHRLRARVGIEGKVSSTTEVIVQLATGSDDPVSTNQTLDGAFSTKSIGLDLAYLQFSPEKLTGLTILGGKLKNPFYKPGKSELIWDSDFNPEGAAAQYVYKAGAVSFTLIGSGLWIDERSSGDDSWLGAGQGVLKYKVKDTESSFTVGGGFFNYVNARGFEPFFDHEDGMGNSVTEYVNADDDTLLVYANDYELVELFAEFSTEVNDLPLTIMGDYVTNTAADSLDDGWLLGLRLGKTKEPGSWSLRYLYREVKKDAVLGLFTDSDFSGGGTDGKGHEIGGAVRLAVNTDFKVTYFANKIGRDAEEEDFGRLQVDLQLKF